VSEGVSHAGRVIRPRAHLDAVTTGGFAEGWAFDRDNTAEPLLLRVLDAGGEEFGRGHANLHRTDLADGGLRHGWCAFRIRLTRTGDALRGTRLVLQDVATGTEVHASENWRVRDSKETPHGSIESVMAEDPTMLRSLRQLSGYAPVLAAFAERYGIPDFVRTACTFILGRLPEETVLQSYERLLANGAVTPFGLLAMLGESEELRAKPRLIPSPVHPGFPFAA